MSAAVWVVVFIFSILVLSKAADYFTESAEHIGRYFGLSSFIIGGTIVAFGTSLPELTSSIIAVFAGSSEIVVGNVIGSNITNLALVLGLVALIAGKNIHVNRELVDVDLPLLIGSALLFAFAIWDQSFTTFEALVFLAGLILFILYTILDSKKTHFSFTHEKSEESEKKITPLTFIVLIVSGTFVYLGARYTIESVIALSEIFSIGTEIIAVFAVALGTSLPELAVSISAIRKNRGEIAVGNILGSNIFNIFAIMGIPALFGTLAIPTTILIPYLPIMFGVTLLYYFMASDKSYTRWEGVLLLLFYLFFLTNVFTT